MLPLQEIEDFFDLAYGQEPGVFMNYGASQLWQLLQTNLFARELVDRLCLKHDFDPEIKKVQESNESLHVTKLLKGKTGDEYIALCIAIIKIYSNRNGYYIYRDTLVGIKNSNISREEHRDFLNSYVKPIVNYFKRQNQFLSHKVSLLNRYQLFCINHEMELVYSLSETEITRRHLPKFLFMSGIDYPLYETVVGSGRIDVFSEQNSLIIEAKIYNGTTTKVIYQCVSQAIARLEHFSFIDAYVVIINRSKNYVMVEGDGTVLGAPYWLINNKHVFVFVINIEEEMLKIQGKWESSIKTISVNKSEFLKSAELK